MLVFLSQSLFKTSKTKIILKYTIMRKSTGRAKPVTPKAGVIKPQEDMLVVVNLNSKSLTLEI